MPDKQTRDDRETAALAAKQFVLANRAAMETILRPYGLGGTQWWVLSQVAAKDGARQRDLATALHVERATASELVLTLVRKGLIEQSADPADQRQKLLHLTEAGRHLWEQMPDPLERLYDIAFAGIPVRDLELVARLLGAATQRLLNTRSEGAI
ncbi:MAG: MarR family winged helix-turn-helix transcriptional regulator [Nocardioidaceae bacterium]